MNVRKIGIMTGASLAALMIVVGPQFASAQQANSATPIVLAQAKTDQKASPPGVWWSRHSKARTSAYPKTKTAPQGNCAAVKRGPDGKPLVGKHSKKLTRQWDAC